MKNYPWFKDCIDAIDAAVVPIVGTIPYRSERKNEYMQNVMTVFRSTCVSGGYALDRITTGYLRRQQRDKILSFLTLRRACVSTLLMALVYCDCLSF